MSSEAPPPDHTHIVCCVDSTKADKVFDVASHLVTACNKSHLTVFSAHRPLHHGGDALLHDREPRAIALHFEGKCVSLWPKPRFDIITAELPDGVSVRSSIMDVVTELRGDIVVLGYTGRKGPKEDPMIMGSATDMSLRDGRTTALVVKSGGPYDVITVALDSSDRSINAFRVAMLLSFGAKSVIAIYVEEAGIADDEAASEALRKNERVNKDVIDEIAGKAASSARVTMLTVVRRPTESACQAFIRASEDNGASLVVSSPRDAAKNPDRAVAQDLLESRLGSFTETLVKTSPVDVLVVHPQVDGTHGISKRHA